MVDDAFPGVAGMGEDAGKRAAVERVEDQHDGDDRQRPADAAARRLQQHHDHDRAHDPVDRIGIADAELQIVEDPRHVEARHRGRDSAEPSRAGRCRAARSRLACGWSPLALLVPGEDQEDQAEHEGEMDAAVGGLGQQAEARGVVVEAREREQQRRHDPARSRQQRAKAHLRIELRLELLQISGARRAASRLVHAALMARPVPLRGICGTAGPDRRGQAAWQLHARGRERRTWLTSAGRLPCRTSRRRHAAECRRPASAVSLTITLPLAWPASSAARVLSLHSALVIS